MRLVFLQGTADAVLRRCFAEAEQALGGQSQGLSARSYWGTVPNTKQSGQYGWIVIECVKSTKPCKNTSKVKHLTAMVYHVFFAHISSAETLGLIVIVTLIYSIPFPRLE